MTLAFVTATPLEVTRGSGTFRGIHTLARALGRLGVGVRWATPRLPLPIFTLRRLLFNERLRWLGAPEADVVVGFDMDGYRIAGRGRSPHVASIKGVIADEMRFERGWTRASMALQAACESLHVRRADLVVTTSRYAASRIRALYGLESEPAVVPELIDLEEWRSLLARQQVPRDESRFTVLAVGRFYPRKRLSVLLQAAGLLRERIPGFRLRIVGGGPEERRLRRLARQLGLEGSVRWLGNVSQEQLAREYNRADVFCLPSVQEGFGIVFLEAMAAGKPIVAARAAAVPEVVPQGLLVEPEDPEALSDALERVCRDTHLRRQLVEQGLELVEQYDAPRVAGRFLDLVHGLVGGR
ncbi:MAG: glycosyltransferase family 4 protein [Bryobacterales bacterium]|nr:glycosyltransferase family 4 protein [Bryobacteraceae bacterium]MDW8131327.1 glycosyltransferase family 4 protein [Bryobacterales bacterium]